MNNLSKKLNNKNGASMVIALVLLLAFTLVGSAMISSTAGSTDKLRNRKAEQQKYLSISSAARLIQNSIGGTVYTGWETNTVYACTKESEQLSPSKHYDESAVCSEISFDINDDAGLKSEISSFVYKSFLSHTKYVKAISVPDTLTETIVISGDNVDNVIVNMSLNTSTYVLTFDLSTEDDFDYAMTLSFKADVNAPEKENAEITHKINADKIHSRLERFETPDGISYWDWVSVEYDITIYTLTTVISYDSGEITKGAFENA